MAVGDASGGTAREWPLPETPWAEQCVQGTSAVNQSFEPPALSSREASHFA